MINGLKESDPPIDYPSIREHGFEHIDDWLIEKKKENDIFAIDWYIGYLNRTILMLYHTITDHNSAIIRRAYKILEKWEG